jgi:hypothetical protein
MLCGNQNARRRAHTYSRPDRALQEAGRVPVKLLAARSLHSPAAVLLVDGNMKWYIQLDRSDQATLRCSIATSNGYVL